MPLLSARAGLVFPYLALLPSLHFDSFGCLHVFLYRLLQVRLSCCGSPTDTPLFAAFSVPTPSASCGLLFVKREPYWSASGQTSALLSLCQLSLGWGLPVQLPAPAALLTSGRRRPQRTWGSSSLPPHKH